MRAHSEVKRTDQGGFYVEIGALKIRMGSSGGTFITTRDSVQEPFDTGPALVAAVAQAVHDLDKARARSQV